MSQVWAQTCEHWFQLVTFWCKLVTFTKGHKFGKITTMGKGHNFKLVTFCKDHKFEPMKGHKLEPIFTSLRGGTSKSRKFGPRLVTFRKSNTFVILK